jgi:hypothetical protein
MIQSDCSSRVLQCDDFEDFLVMEIVDLLRELNNLKLQISVH